MSYPLSALEQPIKKVEFDDRVKLFSFAYMVWGANKDEPQTGSDWILNCGVIDAIDEGHAKNRVMNAIKEMFPECAGYLKHKVSTFALSSSFLSEYGYRR